MVKPRKVGVSFEVQGPSFDRKGKEPKASLGLKSAWPHGSLAPHRGLEGGPGTTDPHLLPYFPGHQMELLPPPASVAGAIRMVWQAPGRGGALVVARGLLQNGDRQLGDTSLNKAAITGEESPRQFSIN